MIEQEITTQSRLLARLVRELLATEQFDTLSGLTEALKCRCARLKIRWTAEDINNAYRLIASNRPLVTPRAAVGPRHEAPVDAPPISRAEASRILFGIYQELERRDAG